MANITGTNGADFLRGRVGETNVIDALGGNDTLNGASLADSLYGGEGSDSIFGGGGDDYIILGSGNDTALGADGNDRVVSNGSFGERKVISLGDGDDVAFASYAVERFTGGDGRDQVSYADLFASSGLTIDLVAGVGSGAAAQGDTFRFIEDVVASQYDDVVIGSSDQNVLDGLAGNDRLSGGQGVDRLNGGNGLDTLTGGATKDFLSGGSGADLFVFESITDSLAARSRRDVIADFTVDEGDRIDLSLIDASDAASGNQAFRFIGQRAFTGEAGQLRYERKDGDTVVFADVDGDATVDLAIQLEGLLSLRVSDFVL